MRCLNVQVDTAISLKRGSGGISCLVGFTISTRFFFFDGPRARMASCRQWSATSGGSLEINLAVQTDTTVKAELHASHADYSRRMPGGLYTKRKVRRDP